MTDYASYFLNSASSVVQLELLEISHPSFSQDYKVVRNSVEGVTVTLETDVSEYFSYYPLRISQLGSKDDLDQSIKIDFGDLGEILPRELDLVQEDFLFTVKPTVKYRVYRSDNLSQPLFGPINLEVTSFSFTEEGATFEAKAPSLNVNRTGELYRLERFPMLRGLL